MNAGPKLASSSLCFLKILSRTPALGMMPPTLRATPSQIHPKTYPGNPQVFVCLDVVLRAQVGLRPPVQLRMASASGLTTPAGPFYEEIGTKPKSVMSVRQTLPAEPLLQPSLGVS